MQRNISDFSKSKLLKKANSGSFGVVLRKIKEKRQQRRNALMFIIGLVLNIAGSGIGWVKCEIERELVEYTIEKKLEEHGLILNQTMKDLKAENATENSDSKPFKMPSIIVVFLTTSGRILNVVGTIKMFQACAAYISLRRRKNLRTTTERISSSEGESEWSDAIAECCTLCSV
uniref:Uncharacterized protein n=1 Tax=Panagrolaimus sp. JU765 TaxID=591449 RepID=A0AC34QTE1_9BILA